ncbi:efflux RND transporter periplasmic adaptor subunit [Seleniivibrio woodruffii]|uniref:efflux RND transporter periplasmic adaptor subunit n=1 Tax=Seleniivibrio woodruffii TaxID=1078050 RepID=UPI002409B875|nr:efflux RND transporter periplasmic adaptor subunit [Seleniivibrio woodruffii]
MSGDKRISSGWKNPGLVKTILGAVAVAAACAAFFFPGAKVQGEQKDAQKSAEKKQPAAVETASPSYREIRDTLTAVGTLLSNESVVITSERAGKITGIFFGEGQDVKAGQVLVRLDDSTLKAELDKAETDRALNEANFRRADELSRVNAVSKQDRDSAYADWQRSEAAVRLAKAELDKTAIKAPFSGTAGLRQVSAGHYIQPGGAIVNLEDISKLKIQFNIPQTEAPKIKPSQRFTLKTDAYPDREFSGRIYAIDPAIDTASRSLTVRGLVDNSARFLRPGQFAQLTIASGAPEKAMVIPESAIMTSASGKSVMLDVDGKARPAAVTTGRRTAGWVEIVSGLKGNEKVVVKGQDRLRPDAEIKAADKSN